MAIWLDSNSKILVQGMTGSEGTKHTRRMVASGASVVAGVTPGKEGQDVDGIPIYSDVAAAMAQTAANVSVVFVPPRFAKGAVEEAVDAGIPLAVVITEGIPVMDMMKVRAAMKDSGARLIGPNCPGIVTPGSGENSQGGCRIGIAPGYIHMRGKVGVVSRSGTLTYEAVYQLTSLGLGQSTCVGIGGDPINGTSHLDVLKMFNDDPETEAIIMIGEIGGTAEEEAAAWAKENCDKPIAGFIAGATAPPGRRMGHAGAIVSGGKGTAEAKIVAMQEAGIKVAQNPSDMGQALVRAMG